MKILVVGLGSMGRRRIRLIKQYDKSYQIVGVDSNKGRCISVAKESGILTYSSIEEANAEGTADCVFVCSSPTSHKEIISLCLEQGMHVFTELNLISDGYEENMKRAEERGKVLFLSSTFLYRKEVEYIKKEVSKSKLPISYTYHVGQYLPDWHPWESYKNFFVSAKETNACREILAIELPWLLDVFGECESIISTTSRMTTLEIDYPDTYCLMLKHTNGNIGMLQVDVVARKTVREFVCSNEELFVQWDGAPDGLYQYDIDRKEENQIKLYEEIDKLAAYNRNIIENAYYEEIAEFFEAIVSAKETKYSFEKDLKILEMIDEVEGEK